MRETTSNTGEHKQSSLRLVAPSSQMHSLEAQDFTRRLGQFNRSRWAPTIPHVNDCFNFIDAARFQMQECEWVESRRREIAPFLANLPSDTDGIVSWFSKLEKCGPGQHDPLFEFLAHEATLEQMRYFIQQEVAGEAGFDDLVAMTQIKCPVAEAKLKMGNNYWDELGRGRREAMHGPLLENLARELGVDDGAQDKVVAEAIELSNLLMAFASNRQYAFHSIGALGSIELTAPARAEKVAFGLKRLGLSAECVRYYALHSTLDRKHWRDWSDHVLRPLLDENIAWGRSMAEGAWMRLDAGMRCFMMYRQEFGLDPRAPAQH